MTVPVSPSLNSLPIDGLSAAGFFLIFCVVFAVTSIGRFGNASNRSMGIHTGLLATRGQ